MIFRNIVIIIVHSKACIRNIFNEKKIEIINRSENNYSKINNYSKRKAHCIPDDRKIRTGKFF